MKTRLVILFIVSISTQFFCKGFTYNCWIEQVIGEYLHDKSQKYTINTVLEYNRHITLKIPNGLKVVLNEGKFKLGLDSNGTIKEIYKFDEEASFIMQISDLDDLKLVTIYKGNAHLSDRFYEKRKAEHSEVFFEEFNYKTISGFILMNDTNYLFVQKSLRNIDSVSYHYKNIARVYRLDNKLNVHHIIRLGNSGEFCSFSKIISNSKNQFVKEEIIDTKFGVKSIKDVNSFSSMLDLFDEQTDQMKKGKKYKILCKDSLRDSPYWLWLYPLKDYVPICQDIYRR